MRSDFCAPSASTIHNGTDYERIAAQVESEQTRDEIFNFIKDKKRPCLVAELPIHPTSFALLARKYQSVFKCALHYKRSTRGSKSTLVTIVTLSNNDKRYIDGWTDWLEPYGHIIPDASRKAS